MAPLSPRRQPGPFSFNGMGLHTAYRQTTDSAFGAFSIEKTAEYLSISRASVWRLLKSGALPRARIGGRTVVRRIDADAFLARAVEAAA